mgnify:CR=1 FL=1
MKLEAGLNKLKECYLFAHLTYCILSAACLVGWLRITRHFFDDGFLHYLWIGCMLAIMALIPAQHKIITKTFYRQYRHLHLYKSLYTLTICAIYIPVLSRVITKNEFSLLIVVPVILCSIICGTAYGVASSLLVSAATLGVSLGRKGLSTDLITEYILTLALLLTTAWFVGQSIAYIITLLYQLQDNETYLKHTLNSLGVATLHVNREGRVIYRNRCFEQIFGNEDQDLRGIIRKHLPFLENHLDEPGTPVFGQALDGRGRSLPVQCIIYPVSFGLEKNAGFLLCVHDISLSEKLQEEKIRTNYFIDFINAGVLLTDETNKIIDINRQAELLFNMSRQQILNNSLQDLLNGLAGQQNDAKAAQESSKAGSPHREIMLGGRTMLINCADLRNSAGKLIGTACIINDITAQREMEKKMHRSATLAAIGELAAGTAHEIRNPLTAIKGFLQLMQRKKEARVGDLSDYLDIVLTEVDRINTIVSEFLKLARPEKVELYPVHLHEVISSVWELLKSKALLHKVHMVLDMDRETPAILGNVDLLKQVIINLVNNAIQASRPGGTVRVATTRLENGARLVVADDGTGIEPPVLQRIFDPYFTTRDEGTGLGLAITNRIVNDHNAVIDVSSTPGQGTEFRVDFPAAGEARNGPQELAPASDQPG